MNNSPSNIDPIFVEEIKALLREGEEMTIVVSDRKTLRAMKSRFTALELKHLTFAIDGEGGRK